ncbi:GNAT family N-acetyltransferase [Nesterenkonia lacusekhoensis]|uniref:GNAT family N-acetyltransferase n=1 Tax=Nesterenkonia lacusekhoensis TaxID=150832 RepID=UPI001FD8C34C|nr:GNAT family N-acetyltransferase [Nesterenkonia lacusekhoensis]
MRLPVQRAMEVCPVEVAVSIVGGTWKLTVIKHLMEGTQRFGELSRMVPLANRKTLTRQLRELEEDGVVHREIYPEVPPKVEYSLTALGQELVSVIEAMNTWGSHYSSHQNSDTADPPTPQRRSLSADRPPQEDHMTETLQIRMPLPADEEQVRAAQAELAAEDFDFSFQKPEQSWEDYLEGLRREHEGVDLAPGRVPATMFLGTVGEEVVGRVHIRHELTPTLREMGGHIGYAVRPQHRRRGYATQMLRLGLQKLRELGVEQALVTCEDTNLGSIRTIEACGGVLEDIAGQPGTAPMRRYWVDLVG